MLVLTQRSMQHRHYEHLEALNGEAVRALSFADA